MTQLTIISVGALKEEYLTRAVAEYEKRLSAFCRVGVLPDAPDNPCRDR